MIGYLFILCKFVSMKKLRFIPFLLVLIALLLAPGCTTVQSYQKIYLNDSDMVLDNRTIDEFGLNFQSYKEGAVGGNAGNKGNGCGCN